MKSLLFPPYLGVLVLAWLIADLVVPALIALSHRFGLLDRPGGHGGKLQRAPIPYLGGLGVFTALAVTLLATLRFESPGTFLPFWVLIAGAAVVVTLGLLDDRRPISAMVKLAVLFAITIALSSSAGEMQLLPAASGGVLGFILTLTWIVGVISATNSLDNTDGVVGGTAAIAAISILAIAAGSSAFEAVPWLFPLAVALVGSALGFLRYNFPPARVYLGDNGSFLIGYLLATILALGEYSTDPIVALLIPCLVLVVPLFDITLATILRVRDGDVRSWRDAVHYCGRDHLAHLLMGLGLSKRRAAACLYALAGAGGAAAFAAHRLESRVAAIAIALLFAAALALLGIRLGRVRRAVVGAGSSAPVSPPVGQPERPRRAGAEAAPADELAEEWIG